MSKIEVNQISSQCGSTLTIGQSGDTVTLACGATQTGFGRTGTVDWDTTAKTAGFTAVSGNGYFVNTTSGAITVNLPAGSAGSIVSLKDYANTWNTNNVTVTPNGTDKINGVNGNAVLNTQDQSVTLVYVDSTKGWRAVQDSTSTVDGAKFITATGGTVTCCGDYKIHTFTGPGTFTVTCAGNAAGSNSVDYLVVAGGGGGGPGVNVPASGGSGGGGAGGYRESSGAASGCYTVSPLGACVSALPVTATGYPITVGGGGASPFPNANPGSNSVFSTITSAGGGAGALASTGSYCNGASGGSGGGGGAGNSSATGTGSAGAGNTPPVSPPQGQPGGQVGPATGIRQGGGGGGATQAGVSFPTTVPCTTGGGNGGDGAGTAINPSPTVGTPGPNGALRYFAGGGAGGSGVSSPTPNSGGVGGGGGPGRADDDLGPGVPGTINTGGGGAGQTDAPSPNYDGGSGGSGIVIIRYKYQ